MDRRKWTALSLLLLVILAPWWFSLPLVVGAILFYQDFFEAIGILFISDLLFGATVDGLQNYFILTLAGLLFLMIVEAGRQTLLVSWSNFGMVGYDHEFQAV